MRDRTCARSAASSCGGVDELTAALGDLTGKKPSERQAPAASASARLVHGGRRPAGGQRIRARKPGQTGTDDAHVERPLLRAAQEAPHRRRHERRNARRARARDRFHPVAPAAADCGTLHLSRAHTLEPFSRRYLTLVAEARDSQRARDLGEEQRTTHRLPPEICFRVAIVRLEEVERKPSTCASFRVIVTSAGMVRVAHTSVGDFQAVAYGLLRSPANTHSRAGRIPSVIRAPRYRLSPEEHS